MVPLLRKEAFRKRALPLSVKAWHSMITEGTAPDRSELIRGVIVEKMPKSILHIKLICRLLLLLQRAIPEGAWIRQEAPLTLADSEPEPDLSVVSGSADDYQDHPATAKLVIEVSVSTLEEDREMAAIYAEAGIEEYWIVNAPQRCLEIHRSPSKGRYGQLERIGTGGTAQSLSAIGFQVAVSSLFEGLPGVAAK